MQTAIAAIKKEIGGTQDTNGFTSSRIDANEAKLAGITGTVKKYVDDEIAKVDAGGISQTITDLQNNKANKVANAKAGNLAKLSDTGDLVDSGKSLNDLAWASDFANLSVWKTAVMDGSVTVGRADNANYASDAGNADNASYATTAGDADTLDSKHASDFATATQGATADSALQSVKVLGHTLTKANNEITIDQAKTALGISGNGGLQAQIGANAEAARVAQQTAENVGSNLTNNYKTWTDTQTAIQGSTTNTVKDCVDAINTMNNKTGEVIGTVENIVSQLTWGAF